MISTIETYSNLDRTKEKNNTKNTKIKNQWKYLPGERKDLYYEILIPKSNRTL